MFSWESKSFNQKRAAMKLGGRSLPSKHEVLFIGGKWTPALHTLPKMTLLLHDQITG
jgi:hypothetical protein